MIPPETAVFFLPFFERGGGVHFLMKVPKTCLGYLRFHALRTEIGTKTARRA